MNFPVLLTIAGTVGSRQQLHDPIPVKDGRIVEVKIHWPNGCNGLVQVAVYLNRKQFLPYKGFLNLNDIIAPYYFNPGVRAPEGDDLWVDFWNGDGANQHMCSVTVTVAEGGGR